MVHLVPYRSLCHQIDCSSHSYLRSSARSQQINLPHLDTPWMVFSNSMVETETPTIVSSSYFGSCDPWEAFLPLNQHLQNLQPTPPAHAPDDPTNKANSSTPTDSNEHPSSSWRKIFCPWPPCRPDHQHPPETPRPSLKVLFSKDKDVTGSSSDEDYMNLSSPWFMQFGIFYFFKVSL